MALIHFAKLFFQGGVSVYLPPTAYVGVLFIASLPELGAIIFKRFLSFFFFWMWTVFQVFTESVTVLLLFYVFGFLRHVGPGMEPHRPLHWKHRVLTTELPGKSRCHCF